MMQKAWSSIEDVYCYFSRLSLKFQGHTRQKIADFYPNLDFRTVTQIWIHWFLWNDAQSLTYYRRGDLLFSEVIHPISRSQGTKTIADFHPNWAFPDYQSNLNSPIDLKWCTKIDVVKKRGPIFFKVIHQITRSHGLKNRRFESNLRRFLGRLKLSDLPCFALCQWYVTFTYGLSDVTYNVRGFDIDNVAMWAFHKFDNPSGA